MPKTLDEFKNEYSAVAANTTPAVRIKLLTELHYEFNNSNLKDAGLNSMLEETRRHTVETLLEKMKGSTHYLKTNNKTYDFTFDNLEQAFIPTKYNWRGITAVASTLFNDNKAVAITTLETALTDDAKRNANKQIKGDKIAAISTLCMLDYDRGNKYINNDNRQKAIEQLKKTNAYAYHTTIVKLKRQQLIKQGCEITYCDQCGDLFKKEFFPYHIANRDNRCNERHLSRPMQISIDKAHIEMNVYKRINIAALNTSNLTLRLAANDLADISKHPEPFSAASCQALGRYAANKKWHELAMKMFALAGEKYQDNENKGLWTLQQDILALPPKAQNSKVLDAVTTKIENTTLQRNTTRIAQYNQLMNKAGEDGPQRKLWFKKATAVLIGEDRSTEPQPSTETIDDKSPADKLEELHHLTGDELLILAKELTTIYTPNKNLDEYIACLKAILRKHYAMYGPRDTEIFSYYNNGRDVLLKILRPVITELTKIEQLDALKQMAGDLKLPKNTGSFEYTHTIFDILAWQDPQSKATRESANYWLQQLQPSINSKLKLLLTLNGPESDLLLSRITGSDYAHKFIQTFCPNIPEKLFNPRALRQSNVDLSDNNRNISKEFVTALYLFKWRDGYRLPSKFTIYGYNTALTQICTKIALKLLSDTKNASNEAIDFIGQHLAFIDDQTLNMTGAKIALQTDSFTALKQMHRLQHQANLTIAKLDGRSRHIMTMLDSRDYRELQLNAIDIFVNDKLTNAVANKFSIASANADLVKDPTKLAQHFRDSEQYDQLREMYQHNLVPLPNNAETRGFITRIDCENIDRNIIEKSLRGQAKSKPKWLNKNRTWLQAITGETLQQETVAKKTTNIYSDSRIDKQPPAFNPDYRDDDSLSESDSQIHSDNLPKVSTKSWFKFFHHIADNGVRPPSINPWRNKLILEDNASSIELEEMETAFGNDMPIEEDITEFRSTIDISSINSDDIQSLASSSDLADDDDDTESAVSNDDSDNESVADRQAERVAVMCANT